MIVGRAQSALTRLSLMDEQLFRADDAWFGGFYELAIEVGPRSDDRLGAALSTLWKYPNLRGCFLDRSREPSDRNC